MLLQRNKLLKELFFHPEYEEMLDVWDMQLASLRAGSAASTGEEFIGRAQRD
ncbi:MAG: hypothetical protein ACLR8P_04180 [Clostridium fessum]